MHGATGPPRGESELLQGPGLLALWRLGEVRSTLRQFVRDWAKEGQAERAASYTPLISALLKHLPLKGRQRAPAVLCPGCGLARLPFDLVRLGYAAQGNEPPGGVAQGA